MTRRKLFIGLIGLCLICAVATIVHNCYGSIQNEQFARLRYGQILGCKTRGEVLAAMKDIPPAWVQTSAIHWRIGAYYMSVEFEWPVPADADEADARIKQRMISTDATTFWDSVIISIGIASPLSRVN